MKRNHRLPIFLLAAACLLGAGGLLYAAWLQTPRNSVGDACIGCHVAEFNQGAANAQQHPPFRERQCAACHLAPGSSWDGATTTPATITGTAVLQTPLWRKQQIFEGESHKKEHQVTLTGLDSETAYRFRVRVAEEKTNPLAESLWLGLKTGDVENTHSQEMSIAEGLGSSRGNRIESLTINIIAADTAIIFWTLAQPHGSWLELQELTADEAGTVANSGTNASSSVHPPLRDSVELAINACYQCHPESSLGTSHPVRLYGGRDVQIPDALPTVDGMLTCVTCHDPHGAPGKMLVREVIKTKLCVTCHYTYKNSSPSTMFRD